MPDRDRFWVVTSRHGPEGGMQLEPHPMPWPDLLARLETWRASLPPGAGGSFHVTRLSAP